MTESCCFEIYRQCVQAVNEGELIQAVSERDKEFHFQNWFKSRLEDSAFHFDQGGRNQYPDFKLVNFSEGYEVKGLAWPGRDRSFDANSQIPSGYHNGRQIFYVFGRYPANLSAYKERNRETDQYPVVDLVICHGDFLNAGHEYIHKNRSFGGFGTFGDIQVRDRKMFVAPTPFALTEGTTGLATLIVREGVEAPDCFRRVGILTRIEASHLVVAYSFDLQTTQLFADRIPNPRAGQEHHFIAYRLLSEAAKPVTLSTSANEE